MVYVACETLMLLAILIGVAGWGAMIFFLAGPRPLTRLRRWLGFQVESPRDRMVREARIQRRAHASRVRSCANCGEPTNRGRWCSDSCFYHEDGWDRE